MLTHSFASNSLLDDLNIETEGTETVVADMHIPRYQLAAWLKTTEWELFNPWLTHLRIEEAKRVMKEHPDWSNDAIANQCGFSSRTYFQNVFHKQTGMTPSEFVER